jgi:hypothetical protein
MRVTADLLKSLEAAAERVVREGTLQPAEDIECKEIESVAFRAGKFELVYKVWVAGRERDCTVELREGDNGEVRGYLVEPWSSLVIIFRQLTMWTFKLQYGEA